MIFFNKRKYPASGGIKELLNIAFPMIISTACDGVMTFTDRLFLARVGSEQMNAALGGGVTVQMLLFFFMGLIGYSTALVAQYMGAGESQNSPKASFQSIIITLIAWPIILLLKPLTIQFYHVINISVTQIAFQIEYLTILAWGSLFSLMRYTLGCYFSGIGKTKVVMRATIVAMIVNVVLDYLLIFGKFGFPNMGIQGAAIATVAGSIVATVMLIFAYLSRYNQHYFQVMHSFRFDWTIMKKLLYYGSPAGLEMFLNFLAFFFMTAMFHSQGEVVATATTIMFNWDLVSFIPLLGIEIAVTSLVGRYMGAGHARVAEQAAYSGIKTGMFYSVIILFLFLLVPETLVRIFRPEVSSELFEKTVPIAVNMIRIAALYVLAESLMVAIIGALRGAGDTYFTMMASVAMHWSFVPVLYLSFYVFNLSVEISWLLLVLFFLVFCGVLVLRFRSGKWKKIKVIDVK